MAGFAMCLSVGWKACCVITWVMLLMMALTLHFLNQLSAWMAELVLSCVSLEQELSEHCYNRIKAGRSFTPYVELHIAQLSQLLIKVPSF